MFEDEYLTLGKAETESNLPKRDLRRLVRTGRLPAIRKDGRWHIHREDLSKLELRAGQAPDGAPDHNDGVAMPGALETANASHTPADAGGRAEMLALIELLKERDDRLATLQDERVRLASQVGYLQAQLAERDARLHLLEATAIEAATGDDPKKPEPEGSGTSRDELALNREPRSNGASPGTQRSTMLWSPLGSLRRLLRTHR
ncbi:MAG: hypothetical protein JWO42_2930 [Chloroflexi bacterium]|jgi:hypothetical protein|nr:hypothetical protein [Chloroflexota bacterium]